MSLYYFNRQTTLIKNQKNENFLFLWKIFHSLNARLITNKNVFINILNKIELIHIVEAKNKVTYFNLNRIINTKIKYLMF